jgi:anti-anti-sigma factor
MDTHSPGLEFAAGHVNGHHVVGVAGDIDISTAPALDAYLTDAIIPDGGDLVVDLSAVTFMDACGLSVLLRADSRAAKAGGRLRLAAPTPAVIRLLAITRLDRHFATYPTSPAATVTLHGPHD